MLQRWIEMCQSRPRTLLAVWALLLAVQVGPWWYSSIDSASYLSIARSLARGTGPTNLGSHLLWYSPGYPALISPFFLLADRPFLWISLFQWLLAVGLVVGIYRWASRLSPDAAIWIAGLTVVNHGFWIHFRRPLSEIAFMCVLVWAIDFLRALMQPKRSGPVDFQFGESDGGRPDEPVGNALCGVPGIEKQRRSAIIGTPRSAFPTERSPERGARCIGRARFTTLLAIGAALVASLCVIRPVGIMLVPAFAVWAWRERAMGYWSWRRALVAVAVVGIAGGFPVGLFVAHERAMAMQTGGRSYIDNFDDAARSPWQNYSRGVQLCVSDLGRVSVPGLFKSHGMPGDWTDVNMLIHVPFFIFLSYGWWRWLKRRNDLFAWYLPFYLLLIAAHAMDTGARLMLPLLPALFSCLWFATEGLGRWRTRLAAASLSAQLIVAAGYWLAIDLPRARRFDRQWPAVEELSARISRDPGAVMVSQLAGETALMLELALDHPVCREVEPMMRPRWLVTPGDHEGPTGFLRSHTSEPLALWSVLSDDHRRPAALSKSLAQAASAASKGGSSSTE